MKANKLQEANSLDKKIKEVERKLNTVNELIEALDSGRLVLELKVYSNLTVRSHTYDDKDNDFDYILSAIKVKYEKELYNLQKNFDDL